MQTTTLMRLIATLVLSLVLVGCSTSSPMEDAFWAKDVEFVVDKEADIKDVKSNRDILDVLARYRQALVRKNFGEINALVASDYYDNSSTTNTTRDDYGQNQLPEIFELLANHAESIQYRIVVKGIEIEEDRAFVDYEYRYAYQYRISDEIQWDAGVDVNRVQFKRVGADWKITSGL